MKQKLWNLLLLTFLFLLSFGTIGCEDKTVATVDGQAISESEFLEKYKGFVQMHTGIADPEQLKGDSVQPIVMGMKKETLAFLIDNRLIQAECDKRGLKVTPEAVEEKFQSIVASMGLPEKDFLAHIAKKGMTKEKIKEAIADQLKTETIAVAINPNVNKVSEAAIAQYFRLHHKEYDRPDEVRARHILIQAAGDSSAEKEKARKIAQEILAAVQKNPGDFEKLAREKSTDKGSAAMGGDLGFFSADMMVAPFSKAAFSTAPGQITPHLVESQYGFHIIQVVEKHPAKRAVLAEHHQDIQNRLRQQQLTAELNRWLAGARAKSKITYAEGYDFDAELKKQQQALAEEVKAGQKKTAKEIESHAKSF